MTRILCMAGRLTSIIKVGGYFSRQYLYIQAGVLLEINEPPTFEKEMYRILNGNHKLMFMVHGRSHPPKNVLLMARVTL